MMIHRYLIGYMTVSKHGTQQIVSAILDRSKPISTSKDIEDVEARLKTDLNVDKVVLLGFSPLKGEI